jgi:hypothetical protein
VALYSTTLDNESEELMKDIDGLLVLDQPNGLTSRVAPHHALR